MKKDFIYFIYDKVSGNYLNVLYFENHETFKRSFSTHLLGLIKDPAKINSLSLMNDCDVYYFSFDNFVPCQEKMNLLLHVSDLIADLKSKNGITLDKVDK